MVIQVKAEICEETLDPNGCNLVPCRQQCRAKYKGRNPRGLCERGGNRPNGSPIITCVCYYNCFDQKKPYN